MPKKIIWSESMLCEFRDAWEDKDKTIRNICKILKVGRTALFEKARELNLPRKKDLNENSTCVVSRDFEDSGNLSGVETLPYLYGEKNPKQSSYERLMKIIQNQIIERHDLPEEIKDVVSFYFSVVINRAVQIHEDINSMPRNVRDGLIVAYMEMEKSLDEFEGESFSIPSIPRVLSGGAALNKKEFAKWERANFAMFASHFPRRVEFTDMPSLG